MRSLYLFLLLLPSVVWSQTYTGRTVSEAGRPVAQVSVVATDVQHKTVAFARSGSDGSFSVKVPEGRQAVWLVCSKMGFARDTIALRDYKQGQTIILRETAVQIKEVTVKAQKIREEGDTLNYNVAAFQQKQDRSIADVIKKMPGMKVNEDGSIEYEGKRINKFYVEGMDLTGSKYAQVSENLQADKVKKVQVMRNHQPVKALKNISFSEQAALNIVLKDEAKNVWQGFVDAAGGHTLQGEGRWLCDSRLMAMLFARQRQSVSMFKTNNTGKDISREVVDIGSLLDYAPTESGLLSNISLAAPQLPRQRSSFNQTHMLATNWLFKTRGDNDLRVQLNGLWDNSDQQRLTETTYTDVLSGATVVEDVTATSRTRQLNGELQYKVNTDQLYVNNSLKGYIDFNSSCGQSLDGQGLSRTERVKPRQRYLTDQLRVTKTIGHRSYRANAYLSYNDLPGQLLLTNDTWQQLDLQTFFWGASTGYGHKLGRADMTWTLSEDARHQRMHNENYLGSGRDRYDEYKTTLQPALVYKTDELRLSLEVPLTWLARTLNDRRCSDLLIEPTAYVRYEPTPRWEFSGSYAYGWTPLDLKQSGASPVFTSYLTLQQGGGTFDNTTSHTASAFLSYHNALKSFFTSLRLSASAQQHLRLYRSTLLDGGIYRREATDQHTHGHSLNATARISKGFDVARLTFTLEGRAGRSNYRMLLGDALQQAHTTTTSLSFSASAQPASWLSVEEHSAYDSSRQTVARERGDALRSFAHQLKLFLMPGNWQLAWTTDLNHSADRTVSTNVFCDLSLSYRQKRYEAGIYCYNLMGNRNYERRVVSNTYTTYTQNRLRPREILMRIYFNL